MACVMDLVYLRDLPNEIEIHVFALPHIHDVLCGRTENSELTLALLAAASIRSKSTRDIYQSCLGSDVCIQLLTKRVTATLYKYFRCG